MGNIDFQAVLESLKNEVSALAIKNVQSYKNEAKVDGLKLIDSLQDDIAKWGKMLADENMSVEDVEFLILSKKELIEMNALKQAGMAMIKVDEFKESLLQLILKTLVGLI